MIGSTWSPVALSCLRNASGHAGDECRYSWIPCASAGRQSGELSVARLRKHSCQPGLGRSSMWDIFRAPWVLPDGFFSATMFGPPEHPEENLRGSQSTGACAGQPHGFAMPETGAASVPRPVSISQVMACPSLPAIGLRDTRTLGGRDMDKDVPSASLRLDKAETLGGIGPFHDVIGHGEISCDLCCAQQYDSPARSIPKDRRKPTRETGEVGRKPARLSPMLLLDFSKENLPRPFPRLCRRRDGRAHRAAACRCRRPPRCRC